MIATIRRASRSCFVLAVFLLLAQPPAASGHGVPESFAELAEALTPAVVSVSVKAQASGQGLPGFPQGTPFDRFFEEFFERHGGGAPRQSRPASLGSGFIVDAAGHVVTNAHVVEGADEVAIRLDDGSEYRAVTMGVDPKTDIALLKIEAEGPFPFVTFGDSDAVRVGDWAVAIGNPFGFGSTVTAGIISARQRDINAGPYDEFLQTDAPINRGNSGGPLFNMKGEAIGVNTAIYSPSGGSVGIGFAVPANIAAHVVDQLMEFGRTRRGWLGVRIQPITPDLAEALDLDSEQGALVAMVMEGSPAEAAGLRAGDVIVRFDGGAISQMRELPRAVALAEVGREVEVVARRNGEERAFTVVLGELEKAEQQLAESGQTDGGALLGMTVAPATGEIARRFGLDDDAAGLVVTEVAAVGAAAAAGIRVGDLVLEVARRPVASVGEMRRLVAAAREAGIRALVIRVEREGSPLFIAVQLDE